jgi:hypothetical protein
LPCQLITKSEQENDGQRIRKKKHKIKVQIYPIHTTGADTGCLCKPDPQRITIPTNGNTASTNTRAN